MTEGDMLIVIPCLNEEVRLGPLLDQFASENPNALIVVADGGSTDRSRNIVAERAAASPLKLVLLDNPAKIQAAGVNLAVKRYGTDREWLVRVDAHCAYPCDYARRLVEAGRERRASSVVVPMVTTGESCFQVAAAAAQNSVLGTGGSPHRHVGAGRFVDHGHHALMRIGSFKRAGGYCEDLAANEDAELDHRLAKLGERIWLEPSLALTYSPRATASALWLQYFRYGRGRARMLLMHRARPKTRQILPLGVPIASAMALLASFSWWFAAPLIIWTSLLLAASCALGIREGRGCALLSGAAAGIMQFAWGSGFLFEALRPTRFTAPSHRHTELSEFWPPDASL